MYAVVIIIYLVITPMTLAVPKVLSLHPLSDPGQSLTKDSSIQTSNKQRQSHILWLSFFIHESKKPDPHYVMLSDFGRSLTMRGRI